MDNINTRLFGRPIIMYKCIYKAWEGKLPHLKFAMLLIIW
jgi:hypothetical protein